MKMFYKKDNCLVEVYKFFEDKTALIFSPSAAGRQNGNGWAKIKITSLIPKEYYDTDANKFTSETKKNKIKRRLTLTSAIWTCTDGMSYEDINEAIKHEKEIIEND